MLLTAIYVGAILFHVRGWRKVKSESSIQMSGIKISVIIPFRNEAQNIANALEDLINQSYSTSDFDIILVNDHSIDNSADVVGTFVNANSNVVLLELQREKGKKSALALGIEQASGEFILTTDADVRLNSDWVASIASEISSSKTEMLVMPVQLDGVGFFGKIQELEHLSLQGITGSGVALGKPVMASGANLAFKKQTFLDVGGYEGNQHLASGDDTFLLQKFHQRGHPIRFASAELLWVKTEAERSFLGFVRQRMRWGKKASSYILLYPKILAILVFLVNLFLLVYPLLWWVHLNLFYAGLLCFGIKASIDFLFLLLVTSHFGKKELLPLFIIEELMYIPYAVIIPLLSFVVKEEWKDRGT